LRCILDEIFGPGNFRNEIVWKRKGGVQILRANTTFQPIPYYFMPNQIKRFLGANIAFNHLKQSSTLKKRFTNIDEIIGDL